MIQAGVKQLGFKHNSVWSAEQSGVCEYSETCLLACVLFVGTVPHIIMIIWWMMFLKRISPVMYYLIQIVIKVVNFRAVLQRVLSHFPVFGTFRIHEGADNANYSVAVGIEGISAVCLRVLHVDEGLSDMKHGFSIEEHPSCLQFYC